MSIVVRNLAAVSLLSLALSASADQVIWDTGAPNPILDGGSDVYLGLVSGSNVVGPQRWAATPFTIGGGGTTITGLDADWFAASGANTVNYVIWQRNGLLAPTTAVSTGVLGPIDPGIDDPRLFSGNGWLHQYRGLSIGLSAGDYYLTIYGAGAGGGYSSIAWLTGAQGVPASLEQDFLWRSGSFPSPGFQPYAPSIFQPVPGSSDPNYIWNPAFTLYATPEPSSILPLALGAGALLLRRRTKRSS